MRNRSLRAQARFHKLLGEHLEWLRDQGVTSMTELKIKNRLKHYPDLDLEGWK